MRPAGAGANKLSEEMAATIYSPKALLEDARLRHASHGWAGPSKNEWAG